MKNVLIVDDEKPFLLTLSEGLSEYKDEFRVMTALNGKIALDVLAGNEIDLIVTDLKMPVMDGFELLANLNNKYSKIPVIVITAYGTTEIENKIENLGAIQYLEKPLDFNELAERIKESLSAKSSGYLQGITLASFLQLLEMEHKTCTLKITLDNKNGQLFFKNGAPIDAECGDLKGIEAAMEIVAWEDADIVMRNSCIRKKNNVNATLEHILIEAFRRKDESAKEDEERRAGDVTGTQLLDFDETDFLDERLRKRIQEEDFKMSVQDKLQDFASIEGFAGVGIFTPTGESLGMLESVHGNFNVSQIGVLANNILRNAQKASLDMGTGRGQLVHVEAEEAHIIVRCLNEGTDPLKSEPGKAHIHLVLVLSSDTSIGMAKMKVSSIIAKLAEDFR